MNCSEEELEQLNSQMDQLREETQNKAIRRQQLDGETKVLREQIPERRREQEHICSRMADLKERQECIRESKKGAEYQSKNMH